MVGAVRFELTTSCTRNKRASQATLRPDTRQQKVPVDAADGKKFIANWEVKIIQPFCIFLASPEASARGGHGQLFYRHETP